MSQEKSRKEFLNDRIRDLERNKWNIIMDNYLSIRSTHISHLKQILTKHRSNDDANGAACTAFLFFAILITIAELTGLPLGGTILAGIGFVAAIAVGPDVLFALHTFTRCVKSFNEQMEHLNRELENEKTLDPKYDTPHISMEITSDVTLTLALDPSSEEEKFEYIKGLYLRHLNGEQLTEEERNTLLTYLEDIKDCLSMSSSAQEELQQGNINDPEEKGKRISFEPQN